MASLDPRRIPIIGNDIYQVGQVIDIVSQPCGPDPMIAAYAFFSNVPLLIWSLAKPDPVDYLTTRFGHVHKRIRRRRIIPDAIDVGTGGGKSGFGWAEWKGFQLSQRIGWYFLVADATTDFLINWTSMAYRFSGCQEPNTGWASTAADLPRVIDRLTPGTNQMTGGDPSFSSGWFANASFCEKIHPGQRMATGGASITPDPSNPADIQRVFVREHRGGVNIDSDLRMSNKVGRGSVEASGVQRNYDALDPGATWSLHVEAGVGRYTVNSWRLSVSGIDTPPIGIEHDP